MSKLYINEYSAIGIFGRGVQQLKEKVENNVDIRSYESNKIDVNRIKDPSISRKIRRADKFTKLAVYTVYDMIRCCKISQEEIKDFGVIIVTAFGPHNTSAEFIDEILFYGEKSVSPIKFSHSVHNAAGSYISQLFQINGPVTTITQFKFSFHNALNIAKCFLEKQLCKGVIICAIDITGKIFDQAFNLIYDNLTEPVLFKDIKTAETLATKPLVTEGAAAILISLDKKNDRDPIIKRIEERDKNIKKNYLYNRDLIIYAQNGLIRNKKYYKEIIELNNSYNFSQFYGSSLIGSAFDTIVASMILKNELNTIKNKISSITLIEFDCQGESYIIDIEQEKQ